MLESSSVLLFIVFVLLFISLLFVVLIRKNGTAALIWHEIIKEKITNFIMNQSKERRILNFVLQNAVRGDPCSVMETIDKYCSEKEWAMNVGDVKGNWSRDQHLKDPSRLTEHRTSFCILMVTPLCCKKIPPQPRGQWSSSISINACLCKNILEEDLGSDPGSHRIKCSFVCCVQVCKKRVTRWKKSRVMLCLKYHKSYLRHDYVKHFQILNWKILDLKEKKRKKKWKRKKVGSILN